jgi:hypothetical protein
MWSTYWNGYFYGLYLIFHLLVYYYVSIGLKKIDLYDLVPAKYNYTHFHTAIQ